MLHSSLKVSHEVTLMVAKLKKASEQVVFQSCENRKNENITNFYDYVIGKML